MRKVLTGFLLVILGGCMEADMGGSVWEYSSRAQHFTGPIPKDYRSACTMYLKYGCVAPGSRLMFHGARIPGKVMDPGLFEKLSSLTARHYPPALAEWYMKTGRYGDYWLTTEDLLEAGATPC